MEKVRGYVNMRLTYGGKLPELFSVDMIDLNIDRALDYFKKNSKFAGYYENISLKDNFELLTQQAHLEKDVLAVTSVNVRNETDNTKKFFYNTTNNILTILDHIRHDEMNAMVIKYVGDDFIAATQLFKDYCVILCKMDLFNMLETYTYKLPGDVAINIEAMKEELKISETSFWQHFS
jgi:hypothetical protein